jgi:hypothetical protein
MSIDILDWNGKLFSQNLPEDKTMGNCREGHDKHICQMKDDLEKVKKLVKNPEYVCKSCGRAAKNEENLCNPTKL